MAPGMVFMASGFDVDGNVVNDAFLINTHTSNSQQDPSIASLEDGGLVVTWESYGQDVDSDGNTESTSYSGVYGQRYDANGAVDGDEFRINTHTEVYQQTPSTTGLADGGFVVTWESSNQDGSGYGIFGQRYDKEGNAVGDEFQSNTYTSSEQTTPDVTALLDGGFVVTWQSSGQDGSGYGIYGQRYDANGTSFGDEFQVNTYTSSEQYDPSVTALNDGGFMVTWEGQDASGYGIKGQRFGVDGSTNPFFASAEAFNNTGGLDDATVTVDVLHDAVASLHQTDKVDLTSVTEGQEYSLNISDGTDTHSVSYTAQVGDTVATVRAGLMGSIGADPDVSTIVSAASEGASTILLSTVNAGTGLQTSVLPSASATVTTISDTSANVNQVSLVTVEGTIEAGDGYTLNIGGDSVSYMVSTGDSISSIRDGLLTELANDAAISTTVTATMGAEAGQIILTAATAGISFTASGATTNTTTLVSTDDNAVTVSHELSATDTDSTVYGEGGDDTLYGGGAADNLVGGDGDDRIAGSGGTDVLEGGAGDDILIGGSGSDIIDGDAGSDIATFNGGFADYTVTVEAGALTVTDNVGDTDTLFGIETLRFEDGDYTVGDDGTDTTLTLTADSTVTTLGDSGLITVTNFDVTDPDAALSASGVSTQQGGTATSDGADAVDTAAISAQSDAAAALEALQASESTGESETQNNTQTGTGSSGQTAGYANETSEEFQVNTAYGISSQSNPAVTGLADGGYVVTWDSYGQDGSQQGIYAQTYGPSGLPAGEQFQVHTTTYYYQQQPAITALEDGGFVITWDGLYDGSGWDMGVFGQRYDATGSAQGDEFVINTYTSGTQSQNSVTALEGGDFAVAWYDSNGSTGSRGGSSSDIFTKIVSVTACRR